MSTKIQQYIRPQLPFPASKRLNFLSLVEEDFKTSSGTDPTRQIANGIKAIIAAGFFDGGLDSAKRVLERFDLIIKLPEPKPAPGPAFDYKYTYGNERCSETLVFRQEH